MSLVRGREGFVRVARKRDGCWWLLDAKGRPWFLRAVHGVQQGLQAEEGHGEEGDPLTRLRSWGFNALGVSDAPITRAGVPYLGLVGFAETAVKLTAPGVRLPDVFAPEWSERAATRAVWRCASARNDSDLVGWVTDETLQWGQGSTDGRPTLLQHCLSFEPSTAAYHAAWEFVLALHGGRFEAVARAWETPLPNKEVVRELTRREQGISTRGYVRDHARWTREFARLYFSVAAAAIRAVDPNHLVLGCRFRGDEGAEVLGACTYPAVDVAMPAWRDLPAPGSAMGAQPILAGEVHWADETFKRPALEGRDRRLTSLELMLRRARAQLERTARHPAVAGYLWSQWEDGPHEQPPFARGLVRGNRREARENTELLALFNARAESLHVRRLPE
ncbi:MAG: hypothetical protein HZC55_11980 [Verrucomicrobia bacterium]|nr:hypothetical protein [Verrucomicrobiota bacterium]